MTARIRRGGSDGAQQDSPDVPVVQALIGGHTNFLRPVLVCHASTVVQSRFDWGARTIGVRSHRIIGVSVGGVDVPVSFITPVDESIPPVHFAFLGSI